MQKLEILNKKEVKAILFLLEKQFSFSDELDYAFLQSEKGKIFIIKKDVAGIDFKKLRINTIGLYFASVNDSEIRLTIEGSQLVGPYSKKNILELNKEEAKQWMNGIDLEKEADLNGFVLIKHNDDFLGCGKIKEKKILNFVPKERRINSS